MSYRECEHTETILAAAAAGGPTPELERHARSCPACADALTVERFLAREMAALAAAAPVPDAGAVWHRARARIEAEAVERATRPIEMVRRLAWACGGVAGGGALVRFHAALGDGLARLGEAASGLRWGVPASGALEGDGMLWVAGALVLATMLFGLYTAWAEET
jgi:hypothetical protein